MDLLTTTTDRERSLFNQLNDLIESDPFVDELGLVLDADPSAYFPSATGTASAEQAPAPHPPFFLREHKLAISFEVIPIIMRIASGIFRSVHAEIRRGEFDWADLSSRQNLIRSTRCVLLINADHFSAWNCRRALVERGLVIAYNEIRFLDLLLSKHPKSSESWAYRRWLIMFIESKESSEKLERLFQMELFAVRRSVEIYPRNYAAWTHAQWITDHILVSVDSSLGDSERWIDMHVSDYSAFHHRQTILNRTRNDQNYSQILSDELNRCFDWISRYPGHESHWSHMRYLWFVETESSCSHDHLLELLDRRLKFAQSCINDECSSNYRLQRQFAASFQFWILQSVCFLKGNKYSLLVPHG